jgi:NAD(P)-dependent dehydrogenase (short-subunit alcohol dehydrogenase family)
LPTPDSAREGGLELCGTTALVTGAGQRIGAACAVALAQAGVRVAVHYHRSHAAAQSLCTTIRQQGGEAEPFCADLTDDQQAAPLLEQVNSQLGQVRILVNNASLFHPGRLRDTPLADWHALLAIHLTAPFLLMRAFAAGLAADQAGVVINMIDQRVTRPRPGHLAYTIAKSGLWTLTRIAAMELAPAIRVNAIAPGPILPAMGEGLTEGEAAAQFARISAATPLGRAGSPQHIVDTLLFLVQHPFITGEMICVDGGEHL